MMMETKEITDYLIKSVGVSVLANRGTCTDANTCTSIGIYYCTPTCIGLPIASGYGVYWVLEVIRAGDIFVQKAFPLKTGFNPYYRTTNRPPFADGTWLNYV